MPDTVSRVGTQTEQRPEIDLAQPDEGKYKILIHNDDVTPYDFVILVLRHIFKLSAELAEHITWQAHSQGVAAVCSRPRAEAERLIAEAHTAARANGYPLTFTMEPK
ncbi:MAG: ATP-dependent Clp protease adaptor ClpS [Caldilineaceae bacterium]